MAYSAKVIIHATDDPSVLESIKKAIEAESVKVLEISFRAADVGTKEVYVELVLEDSKVFVDIIRRVEAVKGAAVMAATEPQPGSLSKRSGR